LVLVLGEIGASELSNAGKEYVRKGGKEVFLLQEGVEY
jgi:hypothetical protein